MFMSAAELYTKATNFQNVSIVTTVYLCWWLQASTAFEMKEDFKRYFILSNTVAFSAVTSAFSVVFWNRVYLNDVT